MIEARIECHCPDIRFPDLLVDGRPLRLRQGQVVWVAESVARASRELSLAKRNGAVSVQWRKRFRVAKKPDAPKPRPPPWLNRKKRKPAPPPPPAQPQVDEEALAESVRGVVADEVQKALQGLQGSGGGLTQEGLEAALRNVLGGMAVPSGQAPRVESGPQVEDGPEEPTFIPSKIVREDVKADINTTTSETSSDDLDDTLAALRAMKQGGGRRRRRRSNEDEDGQE